MEKNENKQENINKKKNKFLLQIDYFYLINQRIK